MTRDVEGQQFIEVGGVALASRLNLPRHKPKHNLIEPVSAHLASVLGGDWMSVSILCDNLRRGGTFCSPIQLLHVAHHVGGYEFRNSIETSAGFQIRCLEKKRHK